MKSASTLQLQYAQVNQALAALDESTSCCITTHVNPDGDAIGSVLAVWHVLGSRGCNARIVVPNRVSDNLRWLAGSENIEVYDASIHSDYLDSVAVCVVLDLSAAKRFEPIASHVLRSGCVRIVIDHHMEPEALGEVMCVDTTSAATCAMLVDVLEPLQTDGFAPEVAQALYLGINTDTGGFRFPRTDAPLLRKVAMLVEQGADPVRTYEELYNRSSFSRLVLLGEALAGMALHHDGATCIMLVRAGHLVKHGATSDDVEGFVHHTLTIAGVDVGVLMVELDDQIKLSFRSKGHTQVRDLAASFGGGGHGYAAGARVPWAEPEMIVEQILERLGNQRKSARSINETP